MNRIQTSQKPTALTECSMLITSMQGVMFVISGSQITLTPSRHQIHSKTEMSHAIILEYLQEYFQHKIGRKIRILSLARKKKQYSYKQISVRQYMYRYLA